MNAKNYRFTLFLTIILFNFSRINSQLNPEFFHNKSKEELLQSYDLLFDSLYIAGVEKINIAQKSLEIAKHINDTLLIIESNSNLINAYTYYSRPADDLKKIQLLSKNYFLTTLIKDPFYKDLVLLDMVSEFSFLGCYEFAKKLTDSINFNNLDQENKVYFLSTFLENSLWSSKFSSDSIRPYFHKAMQEIKKIKNDTIALEYKLYLFTKCFQVSFFVEENTKIEFAKSIQDSLSSYINVLDKLDINALNFHQLTNKIRYGENINVNQLINLFSYHDATDESDYYLSLWLYKHYNNINNKDSALYYLEKVVTEYSNILLKKNNIYPSFFFSQLNDLQSDSEIKKHVAIEDKIQTQKRYYQIGLAFSSVLILLLVVIFRIKRRNSKQKEQLLKNEIELKNRKLFSEYQKIQEKQKLISSISYDIKNANITDQETKLKLENNLKRYQNVSEEWRKFSIHFEQVYPSFYKNLDKSSKNLTSNEIKLCSYIKMNLSNKEVAQILNINPESVIKSRYRIRKKINISKEESLDKFIQGL